MNIARQLITTNYSVLTPAYGRDYTSKDKAIADFEAAKDWLYNSYDGSGYCSIRDFADGVIVNLRYNKTTKGCTYTVRRAS